MTDKIIIGVGTLVPMGDVYEYEDRTPIMIPYNAQTDLREALEIISQVGPVKKSTVYKLEVDNG